MDPSTWREMVNRTRELELSMGDGVKRVEDNESETVIVQRRSLRASKSLTAGHIITSGDFSPSNNGQKLMQIDFNKLGPSFGYGDWNFEINNH